MRDLSCATARDRLQRFQSMQELAGALRRVDHAKTLPCETRVYELTGYPPTGAAGRYRPADFVESDPGVPGRLRHRFLCAANIE